MHSSIVFKILCTSIFSWIFFNSIGLPIKPELNSHGKAVQEYPYNMRYLDLQGNRLTLEEYNTKLNNEEQVYLAAYVGCTYHCG